MLPSWTRKYGKSEPSESGGEARVVAQAVEAVIDGHERHLIVVLRDLGEGSLVDVVKEEDRPLGLAKPAERSAHGIAVGETVTIPVARAQTVLVSRESSHVTRTIPGSSGLGLEK